MTQSNPSSPQARKSRYGRFGLILMIIGILLAVDSMADLSFIYKFWPLVVAMPGVGFIGLYLKRARLESLYLGTGIYLLGFSALALYCNFTSWRAISGLWPLFITLMGVSLCSGYLVGRRSPTLLLAGLLLISLSLTFFLVFGVSGNLWWSIFLLLGGSLLIFERVKQQK